jgi:hypothetical protein
LIMVGFVLSGASKNGMALMTATGLTLDGIERFGYEETSDEHKKKNYRLTLNGAYFAHT